MTIELTDKTIGLWTVSLGDEADWLGAVWRAGSVYVLEYRFRYYVDDKTFDSEDKKNWYRAEIQADRTSEEELIRHMRVVVKALWIKGGGQRYEVLMGAGGIEEMLDEMKKWPNMSMQTVPKGSAEQPWSVE